MANIEGLQMKFTVLKNTDIKKYLTLEQKVELLQILKSIDSGRVEDGKQPASENTYVVINTDEPYIDEIIETMKYNGHWG